MAEHAWLFSAARRPRAGENKAEMFTGAVSASTTGSLASRCLDAAITPLLK